MNDNKKDYIEVLENKYFACNKSAVWNNFLSTKKGISDSDKERLYSIYPNVPNSLIKLLEYTDGSNIYFLGSDVDNGTYPYYLLSAKEIIDDKGVAKNNFSDFIDRSLEEVKVSDKITRDASNANWLHFADCMNNGGTSQLFIDFSGNGQIIRYLHDPDSLEVIANSFDEYLDKIIANGCAFVGNVPNTNTTVIKNEIPKVNNSVNKKVMLADDRIKLLKMNALGLIIMSLVDLVALFFTKAKDSMGGLIFFIILILGNMCLFILNYTKLTKNDIPKKMFRIGAILSLFLSLIYLSGTFNVIKFLLFIVVCVFSIWSLILVDKKNVVKNIDISSNIKYKDITIIIDGNNEESSKHIESDYNVLMGRGIDNLIREEFIPWLLGDMFPDKDHNKVFDGLKLYSISYHYGKIIDKYSPTGKEDYFGEFQFCFESGSEYTNDIFESVMMEVYVIDGKIIKVSGYEI